MAFILYYIESSCIECNVDEISEGGIRLKQSILYCCDEDKWKCSDNDAYAEEEEKSLEQVLKELKEEGGGKRRISLDGNNTEITHGLQIDQYEDGFSKVALNKNLNVFENSRTEMMASTCCHHACLSSRWH